MKRDAEWQLQKAKAEFSKLLERSQHEGPQVVTKHGVPTAVVISMRDYEQLRRKATSFKVFLRAAPVSELDLTRNASDDRSVAL